MNGTKAMSLRAVRSLEFITRGRDISNGETIAVRRLRW
jgi:hypothetical protein